MADPQPSEVEEDATLIGRREFVRRVALLAVGAASSPLLVACDIVAPATPAAAPAPALSTPTTTAAATNTQIVLPQPPPPVTPAATAPAPATAPATTPPTNANADADAATQPPQVAEATPTAGSKPEANAVPGPYGVALLASTDRAAAVPAVLGLLGFAPHWLRGKHVALKANFNSADPPPGSTHIDTLRAVLQTLQDWGAAKITLLERSGMGDTRQVLRQLGIMDLAGQFGVDVVVLDDLPARDWVLQQSAHWRRGFLFPRLVQEADAVVQTCCLKTHRFGGHFTMSLKNSVGLAAKYDPTDGYRKL